MVRGVDTYSHASNSHNSTQINRPKRRRHRRCLCACCKSAINCISTHVTFIWNLPGRFSSSYIRFYKIRYPKMNAMCTTTNSIATTYFYKYIPEKYKKNIASVIQGIHSINITSFYIIICKLISSIDFESITTGNELQCGPEEALEDIGSGCGLVSQGDYRLLMLNRM